MSMNEFDHWSIVLLDESVAPEIAQVLTVMTEMLDLIRLEEFLLLVVLCLILFFIAAKVTRPDAGVLNTSRRLAAVTFVIYLAMGISNWRPSNASELLVTVLKACMAAGVVFSIAILALGVVATTIVDPLGRVTAQRTEKRLSKEHVGRVISMIGEEAEIIVRQEDLRLGVRTKFASAHDIRRGCAKRLINVGVSAETLKVIMRHADFATTEKHYGATRSAQAAGTEVRQKLTNANSDALVGRLVGRKDADPTISQEELRTLKSLLERL
jgi:hypothetical protein